MTISHLAMLCYGIYWGMFAALAKKYFWTEDDFERAPVRCGAVTHGFGAIWPLWLAVIWVVALVVGARELWKRVRR